MNKLKQLFLILKSELEYNRENQAFVFAVFLLLEVFVLGYLVILPTYNSISDKKILLDSLSVKQEEMTKTLQILKEYSTNQPTLKPYVTALYSKVPVGINASLLFVNALEATSLGGFSPTNIIISSATSSDSYSSSVKIVSYKIAATGEFNTTPELIKSLEGMSRLTFVTTLNISANPFGGSGAALDLNSFYIDDSTESAL